MEVEFHCPFQPFCKRVPEYKDYVDNFPGEGRIQSEKAEPAGTNRFRREGCGGDVLWVKHVIGCYVRLVQKVRKGRFPYANGNGYGLAHHGKGGKWAGSGIPRVSFGWQVHNKAFHL